MVRPLRLSLILVLLFAVQGSARSRKAAYRAWRMEYVKAMRAYKQGAYGTSLKYSRRAVRRSFQRGRVSGAHIRSLRLLARVAEKAGDDKGREAALRRLVGIARRRKPPSPGAIAAALELGRAFGDLGRHGERLALLDEVEEWLSRVSELPTRFHLAVLMARADTATAKDQPKKAIEIWFQAAELASKLGNASVKQRARALVEGARRAPAMGRDRDARLWLTQARELYSRTGKWTSQRGEILLDLMDRAIQDGRAEEGIGLGRELIQAHGKRKRPWEFLHVAYRKLGELEARSGEIEKATVSFRKALGMLESLPDSDPFQWLEVRKSFLEVLEKGKAWKDLVKEVGQALVLVDQLPPDDVIEFRRGLFEVRGRAHLQLLEYDKAAASLQVALDLRKVDSLRADAEGRALVESLVKALSKKGDHDQAIRIAEDQVSILKNELGYDHESVGHALQQLAEVSKAGGREREAYDALGEAQDILGRVDAPEETLLAVLKHKAEMLERAGRSLEAARSYQAAAKKLGKTEGKAAGDRIELLERAGALFLTAGDGKQAVELLREAYELRKESVGEKSPDTLGAAETLGSALVDQKLFVEAGPVLRAALEGSKATDGELSGRKVRLLLLVAQVDQATGKTGEGLKKCEEALRIAGEISGVASPVRLQCVRVRAGIRRDSGDFKEAQKDLQQAIQLIQQGGGALPEVERELQLDLGRVLLLSGQVKAGVEKLNRAQVLLERRPGVRPMEVAKGNRDVGLALLEAKRPREAEPYLQKASEEYLRRRGRRDGAALAVQEAYVQALEGAGKKSEARRARVVLEGSKGR